jgi:hypothetical protein
MNNNLKIIFSVISFFLITAIIIAVFYNLESYTTTQSTNNLLIVNKDGDIETFQTNKDSLLFTDDNGTLKNLSFPRGFIVAWYPKDNTGLKENDIPSGWSLCDGRTYNGYKTPDLSGKFVFGNGKYKVGSTGGSNVVKLENKHIPPHTHKIHLDAIGTNRFLEGGYGGIQYNVNRSYEMQNTNAGTSGGQPHENMPPFYVLCYICYTGNNL